MGDPKFIEKYKFKQRGKEPLSEMLSLRVSPSLMKKIKEHDNWREIVREVLAKELLAN